MRFETSQSTPPHLNRRLQLRMLSFVMMFAAVVFVWNTLQAPPKKVDDGTSAPRPWTTDQVDYNVRDGQSPTLNPDEFIAAPPDLNRMGDPPAEGQPAWQEPPPIESDAAQQNDVDREIARRATAFDKGLLRNVKDNTLGIRREEADAYYRLLAHARNVPLAELERAGSTDVMYINLMTQPDRFRGEPVTIQGDLWRLYEFQAGPNDRDLKTLYEGWVFTGDSDSHPYRVVFTSLPRELEPGENLRKPVRVTGYFFKREGYPSNGGMHVAPSLLAQRISVYRPPNMAPPTDDIVPYMIGLISAIGLIFLVTLTSFMIGDRRAAHLARERERNAPRPSFDGIAVTNSATVGESLRLLAEQSWHAAATDQSTEPPDAAALLRARDGSHRHDATRVEPAAASDDPPGERPRVGGAVVHNWVARQQLSTDDSQRDSVRPAQQDRERLETERVLDRLQTASTNDFYNGQSYPQNENPSAGSETGSMLTTSTSGANSIVSSAVDTSSRLAEWEGEIQQFAVQRSPAKNAVADHQREARAEVEQDQATRERALREQLLQRRAELEQERLAREETERRTKAQADWESKRRQADRERQLREQDSAQREQRDRDTASHERKTIDRADRADDGHAVESSPNATNEGEVDDSLLTEDERAERLRSKRSGWGWNWSRRRQPTDNADSATPPRERAVDSGDDSTDRLARAEDVDQPVSDENDDASLTEEQRAELRKRSGRRGGWGWPRRRRG